MRDRDVPLEAAISARSFKRMEIPNVSGLLSLSTEIPSSELVGGTTSSKVVDGGDDGVCMAVVRVVLPATVARFSLRSDKLDFLLWSEYSHFSSHNLPFEKSEVENFGFFLFLLFFLCCTFLMYT